MVETIESPKVHENYVVVTDQDGEEYICPKSMLKKKADLSPEELKKCMPESSTGGGGMLGG